MAGSSRFSEIVRDRAPVVRDGRKTDLRVPGRIEFVATGVDIAFVNGLRRTLIGDLVTAAVAFDPADPDGQDIEFLHNSGVLHNEFIGLRVSLIPLHLTRAELASLRTDGVLLELDVTNEGEQPLDVTSRDIKVSVQGGARGGAAKLDRDRVFPPDPVTGRWPLITVLMPHGAAESQA
jgi:DNA-directed RNA polymerase alpha subunit